jgi:Na+/H+ antiporter NhaD/arsenite permease-like protein
MASPGSRSAKWRSCSREFSFAPVFFKLAGGNADELMSALPATLAAISMGAVYMGALTYIGNAPNFMVYAIALERGIRMPSFFGYFAWSFAVLTPVLALVTYVFVVRL